MQKQKIIDKICKCLRLSESCNANEAASALRQAHRLMHKYNVTEEQILAANVAESSVGSGSRYSPPFWVLALSNVVAHAFDCRVLVARNYGCQPQFRFIGIDYSPEVATYTFTVLLRHLDQARSEFLADLALEDLQESERRGDVFAQAWLFRVARTVADFVGSPEAREAIDCYIHENYGETADIFDAPSTDPLEKDYDDILCGMRAANEVALYRSMDNAFRTYLPMEQSA